MSTSEFVAIVLTGTLFGHELATMFVHLAIRRLPARTGLALEQAINRILMAVMPVMMVATVIATAVVANWGAVVCLAAMLAITFIVHIPINIATVKAEADIDDGKWRAMRGRWNLGHGARIALDLAAFLLVVRGAG